MKTVPLREVQHHLSQLLRRIDQGEELVVTRRNRPVARLVPFRNQPARPAWPDFNARAIRTRNKTRLTDAILAARDA